MPDIPGVSDPDEVKRTRAKYLAIKRTERRLRNRLADIDWEYEELRPGLRALEQRITVMGELPAFAFVEDEEPTEEAPRGNRSRNKRT